MLIDQLVPLGRAVLPFTLQPFPYARRILVKTDPLPATAVFPLQYQSRLRLS